MTDLRACIFIDQLQPQTLAYMSTWMRGTLPRAKMAAQIAERAAGLDIEALTDVGLKSAEVRAGVLVVERQFASLRFPACPAGEVHAAADAVLRGLDKRQEERAGPAIQASRIV